MLLPFKLFKKKKKEKKNYIKNIIIINISIDIYKEITKCDRK